MTNQAANIFLQNPAYLFAFVVSNNFNAVQANLQRLNIAVSTEDGAVAALTDMYASGAINQLNQALNVQFIEGVNDQADVQQLEDAVRQAAAHGPQQRDYSGPCPSGQTMNATTGVCENDSFWSGTNFMDVFGAILGSNVWTIFGATPQNNNQYPQTQPQQDNTLLWVGGFFMLIIVILVIVLLLRGNKKS